MMERVLSWALGLTLAVLLLVVAFLQMSGPTPNPIFGLIAARSHIGLFEPWARYLVVLVEVVALAGVVYPKTRANGALLAGLVGLGAIILHLTPWLGIQIPQGAAVSQALAQGRSAADIAAMHLPTDKGGLFLLALAIAVLSAGTFFVEKAKGTGPTAKSTDTVKVNYQGTLVDGKVFDSTQGRGPAEFPLNGVIPCWTEGLQKLAVGGKAKLVCPS